MKRLIPLFIACTLIGQAGLAQTPAITNASILNVSTRINLYNDVPLRYGGSAGYWAKYNSVTDRWELCDPLNTLLYHNGNHGGILGGCTIEGTNNGFLRTADVGSGPSKDLLIYTGSAPTARGGLYLGANAPASYVNDVFAKTPTQGDSSNLLATTGFVLRELDGFTGGGGTTMPAGINGSIQFKTDGAFDYDSAFYYSKSLDLVRAREFWSAVVSSTRVTSYIMNARTLELSAGLRLGYCAGRDSLIGLRGQIWINGADERPRFTDDGGFTFEISLPGQPSHDGEFLSTNGTTTSWAAVTKSTVGLSDVENTALSTWTGSSNITTLGTVTAGSWSGNTIGVTKGGTGLTSIATGSVLVSNSSNTLSPLSSTSGTYYLKNVDGTISWGSITAGGTGSVSSITAGNGMNFSEITAEGAIIMGTPSPITSTSVDAVGTGTHSHSLELVSPAKGGSGVANGTNNTLTFTGNYPLGLTLTGNTSVTLPTSGTLITNSVSSLPSLSTVGTITSGTWNATAIMDTYIASASTWNSKLSSTWSGSSNITTVGTISSGTWSANVISPTKGGTGIANNAANTLTFTGAYSLGITLSGNTSLTFPTSGTLVTTSGYADNVHLYIGNQTTRGNFYHTGSNLFMINNTGNTYFTGSGATNHIYLNTSDGTNYYGNTYTRTQVYGTNNNTVATTEFANAAATMAANLITKTSIGLGSVENTQLSTWTGTNNISQVGTITSGTWSGTAIATTKGGTGLTSIATGSVLVANSGNTLTALASTSGELYLKNTNGTISWAAVAAGGGGAPRVGSVSTTSSLTIDCSSYDQYNINLLSQSLTINAPTGTPVDGQKLMIRIKDNGTSRSLTWNAIFIPFGSTSHTASTTYGKWMYFGCVYNAYAAKWDVVGVSVQGGAII